MTTYKSNLDQLFIKKQKTNLKRAKVISSADAAEYIRQFYFDDIGIYESFFILLLNRSSNTIAFAKISQGGVGATVVDVKIIAKYVADSLASGVIIAHNHPSGEVNPSSNDHQVTRKVQEMLKFHDSVLLDHVILTEDSYYSYADEGLL